jgi:DnaK suppressor protein
MSELNLAEYKDLLLKMKQDVLATASEAKIIDNLQFVERDPGDEVDIATMDTASQLQSRLLERNTLLNKRIDIALKKIDDGTYGECEKCGDPISPKRLLARPVAILCLSCKEKQERLEKREKAPRGFMSDGES